MRHTINLVEKNQTIKFGGCKIERVGQDDMGYGSERFVVRQRGNMLAMFQTDTEGRPGDMCVHLQVREPYRRRGIGTLIYEFCEQLAAKKDMRLLPSPLLTQYSHAVWKKRAPELLDQTPHKVCILPGHKLD
jgi:GNAT superfamily N-acetyltransferase